MDSKFHKLLYKASGSRILEHTLTDFHQYVQSPNGIHYEKKDVWKNQMMNMMQF